jgi:hypothetical protein
MALVEPEILEVPGRPDDRTAIRRIGDGAVVDFLDAHLSECRHALDGGLDIGREAVEILLEQLVFGLRRGTIDVATGRADLVRPEQQPAGFLAHVP